MTAATAAAGGASSDEAAPTEHAPLHVAWPADGGHLWGSWAARRGMPKPERYRQCVHPLCGAVQIEPAPVAPSGPS